MKPIRLFRDLKLRNVEMFRLNEGHFGEFICYMLIVDFNRPSTLDDYPYLKEVENGSEFCRGNFIKVLVVSSNPINKERKNEIIGIASGLLDNKYDCDWNLDFKIVDEKDLKEENVRKSLEVLVKEQYGQDIHISDISVDKFKYLSQD